MNLENNGERMDINYYQLDYNNLDMYQKSHYKRYEMAKSRLTQSEEVGDMACGSGYGSMMLLESCKNVCGVDIDPLTINEIQNRYQKENKVSFIQKNLLDINFINIFDTIVSFETIEHFLEDDIKKLIFNFYTALKPNGQIILSTPYNQIDCDASRRWHKTFYITELKIKELLNPYFEIKEIFYQNYQTHEIEKNLDQKHFIICIAKKI